MTQSTVYKGDGCEDWGGVKMGVVKMEGCEDEGVVKMGVLKVLCVLPDNYYTIDHANTCDHCLCKQMTIL